MSSADDIEQGIAGLHLTTTPETDKRILDDAYAAIGQAVQKQQPPAGNGVWSMFIRGRFALPAAIAAMILLAFALFLNFRTEGINIEGIHAALSEVENIHISQFQAGRTSPVQQIWASEALSVKLFKTGLEGNQAQYTLWDTHNSVKMIKFLSTDSVQTIPITRQMLAEFEKSESGPADMVPFSDKNDISGQALWNRIDDPAVSALIAGTKVYELAWAENSTDSQVIVYRKWRVFVENRTGLPMRIEWYSKIRPEDEYGLERFFVIVYPGDDEIQDVIRNIFGRRDSRRDNPEFIGTPGVQR
ncbi:MAG: hypothetical protein ACYSUX_01695 [Planctomycetota bacterium]|jgi:hypothetical protein